LQRKPMALPNLVAMNEAYDWLRGVFAGPL
jgi:hypothetical protein